MNILLISPNSPRESVGGVERHIINLIDYYKEQEFTNLVLFLPATGANSIEKRGNITIVYDHCLALSTAKKADEFTKKVEEIVKQHKIEIIVAENFHVSLPPAYSLMLNMVALTHKIPLVLQLHSFASTQLQIELINQLKWNHISCVSKSVAGDCFQKGTDINILSTHYLGVNKKTFKLSPVSTHDDFKQSLNLPKESQIVLSASRIILGERIILREKGLVNLIQAFSKLSPRYPNLYLLIGVGRPPERLKKQYSLAYEKLLGYIRLHNIEHHTIVKQFEFAQMPEVYASSDVFVLPSENETFGQVFVEAMACGLPVIGTKTGGIPEIISDSYNGYLVPPDDSSILAQKIEKILNSSTIRESFIKAGIKTVTSTFTSEKQFLSFQNMLEDTIQNYRKAS